MQVPPTRFGPAWLWAGAVLAGGTVPLFEVLGAGMMSTFTPLIGLVALASIPVSLVLLVRRSSRRKALLGLLLGATAVGSVYAGFAARWPVRRFMFERLARRFDPLVRAVERFEREKGRPPAMLDEVVPKWVDEVPGTQMALCRKVEYSVFPEPHVVEVVRYELGAPDAGPARWLPPDAPPRRASSLIVVYGTRSDVQLVETDGIAWRGPMRFLDSRAWREGRGRVEMARDVDHADRFARKKKADVEQELGPPDEAWLLTRGAWEIRVPCGSGGINFDSFFYWPGHAYPGSGFGGGVERVGTWAYVHE